MNRTTNLVDLLPGEMLSFRINQLRWDSALPMWQCDACAATLSDPLDARYAVVYGKPVVLCDQECYEMLRANWK